MIFFILQTGEKMKQGKEWMNYSTRTDLALDIVEEKKIEGTVVKEIDQVKITTVIVDDTNKQEIGKKIGKYITIEFNHVDDTPQMEKVTSILSGELKILMQELEIKKEDSGLIIGLGNNKSTPDSLGPLSIDKIIVTRHLFHMGLVSPGFRDICAFSPGVMGQTGIETSDMIESIIDKIKPKFIIVIDALASTSISRINKTIQMTDSGIHPGSGIGNKRKEISKEGLHVPVIAIGIPTVVDAVTIVSDTIQYMEKKLGYMQSNINDPKSKFMSFQQNYLTKDYTLENKEFMMGLLGTLSEEDRKQFIYEVLSPIGYNFMVTPKEIDFLMEKLSVVVGEGINQALHEKIIKV